MIGKDRMIGKAGSRLTPERSVEEETAWPGATGQAVDD